ncbi:TBC1 domain member 31 [Geranomyces variabilis]|uniref:TBC1 domain family member 31 n=1 Tax=Geranomyces variabilis TaxID=109894 RepID=A0AAD5TS83_9FUNG|nr:TBC1 domain member 31 [Geranomyces variabilis]
MPPHNPPSRTVYVAGRRKYAPLWPAAVARSVLAGHIRKGTILRIRNEHPPHVQSAAFSQRAVAFTRVCFSRASRPSSADDKAPGSYAVIMAAVDQRGGVYVFDFLNNKYWIVAKSGISGSCLTFNAIRQRELIVGLSDNTIACYNIDTLQLISKLPAHHTSRPCILATHPTLPLLISTSQTESILWDTESWERKRLLVGAHSGIQSACFSPTGASIVTAFADAKIIVWTTDTFVAQWNIDLGALLGEPVMAAGLNKENCLSMSKDGELMVFAGLAGGEKIYVWNMVERRLIHEISIPALEGTEIVQIEFLGSSTVTAVLSDAGDMIFIEVAKARFVGQVEGGHKFRYFASSPDGRLLSTIFRDEGCVAGIIRIDEVITPSRAAGKGNGEVSIMFDQEAAEPKSKSPIPPPIRQTALLESTKTLKELMSLGTEGSLPLNCAKLKKFLAHCGRYPDKYRTLIWRILAALPENRPSYEALVDGGAHFVWKDFRAKFPIDGDRVATSMERVLSALAFWAPVFEGKDLLPSLVFPFVKLYESDMFAGFEIIATVLVNWCQKWWEYDPNPPIECLAILEDLLEFHDRELLMHFAARRITSQTYAWTMMLSLFSGIFHKNDWLALWDHFFSNQPWFMYLFVIAYLKAHRVALLDLAQPEDFQFFFTRPSPTIPLPTILKSAHTLSLATPSTLHPRTFFAPFQPLPAGEYPVVNAAPSCMVNYRSRMRDRIAREERERLSSSGKPPQQQQQQQQQARRSATTGTNGSISATGIVDAWWTRMVEEEKTADARRQYRQQQQQRLAAAATPVYGSARRGVLSARRRMDEVEEEQDAGQDQGRDDSALDGQVKLPGESSDSEWLRRGREMETTRASMLGTKSRPMYAWEPEN